MLACAVACKPASESLQLDTVQPALQSAPAYSIGQLVEMRTYSEARGQKVADADGNVSFGGLVFNIDMIQYAGDTMRVSNVITEMPGLDPLLLPLYEMETDNQEWLWPEVFIKKKAR